MTQPNLFDEQQQEEKPEVVVPPPAVKFLHAPKVCANPLCKKEFTPKNSRAQYCCASCNARASQIRLAEKAGIKISAPSQEQNQSVMQTINPQMSLSGAFPIPPHAQMMINHHEKESQRWEGRYNEEVKEHKETKKKLEDLKEELRDNEKPSGLNGFAQSPMGVEVIKAIGPALGEFAMAMARKQTAQSEPAQIGAAPTTMDAQFAKWVGGLKEGTQRNLWGMLNKMAEMDEERMNYVILNTMQYL